MFKKIAAYLFRKKLIQYKKNEIRNKSFVSYDKAKSILLLFESNYSERNPETKKIIEQLQIDGKKVTAIGYVEKKEIVTPAYPDFRILFNKDHNVFQKPDASVLNFFQENEFDLLIDITNREFLPLMYVALFANARCKAGMKKGGADLFDFSIDINEMLTEKELQIDDLEYSFLFDQIIFYLKSIQTND
jgi:hypothetical protein